MTSIWFITSCFSSSYLPVPKESRWRQFVIFTPQDQIVAFLPQTRINHSLAQTILLLLLVVRSPDVLGHVPSILKLILIGVLHGVVCDDEHVRVQVATHAAHHALAKVLDKGLVSILEVNHNRCQIADVEWLVEGNG